MDEEVKKLLHSWNLCEVCSLDLTDNPDYVDKLSDKHRNNGEPLIDLKNFGLYESEDIDTPICSMSSPLCKTNHTRGSNKDLTDNPDYVDNLSNKDQNNREPLTELNNFELYKSEDINTPVCSMSSPITLCKKSDNTQGSNKTLLEILEAKPEGRLLLKLYQEEGLLQSSARQKLCNIIVNELLGNDPKAAKVTNETICNMAQQIKEIFRNENISTYFVPYIYNKKLKIKRCAKGKLYDCLNNRKREYRIAEKKIIDTNNMELEIAVGETSMKDRETIEKDLDWLRQSSEPWKIVEEKWKKTSKIRLDKSKTMSISEYMNEYPALKKPTGYQLLLIDFETLYPDKSQRLYENFPIYRNKILDLAQKKNK